MEFINCNLNPVKLMFYEAESIGANKQEQAYSLRTLLRTAAVILVHTYIPYYIRFNAGRLLVRDTLVSLRGAWFFSKSMDSHFLCMKTILKIHLPTPSYFTVESFSSAFIPHDLFITMREARVEIPAAVVPSYYSCTLVQQYCF